jgi:hypothetical protein
VAFIVPEKDQALIDALKAEGIEEEDEEEVTLS